MISKVILQYRNRVIYLAISVVIFILITDDIWYLITVPFFLIYVFKTHKDLVKCIVLVVAFYSLSLVITNDNEIETAAQYDVVVTKVNNIEDYTAIVGKIDGKLVNVYLSDRVQIRPGDLYTIKGELSTPTNQTVPGNFSYSNYLKSKGVRHQIFANEYVYKKSTFHIGIISYLIGEYIDQKLPLSKAYVKTFVLADKTEFDQRVLDDVSIIGISHLFAVSGLHVGLLVLVMRKGLLAIKVSDFSVDFLISVILLIYVVVTSFSPSVVRAGLMFIGMTLNKRMTIKLSNLDILSLILLGTLMMNPYFYMNPGFVLSFVVTSMLLMTTEILRDFKGVRLLFMVGFISFIVTIPIIINMNYQINLFTLLFNIPFILYMTYSILPFSYISMIFPIFDKLLYLFITIYNTLIRISARVELTIVKGSFTSTLDIMIYYILVMFYFTSFDCVMKRRKLTFAIVLFFVFATNSQLYNYKKSVTFLDVHGDATLIRDSFDRCNILIDTGDADEYNSVINHLKSKNIRRIDYLLITHFHSDHYGEMDDILEEFEVLNIISPVTVNRYKGRDIKCGSTLMYTYDLSSVNQNENNNSLITSLFIGGKHYLFTGDSEIEREREFVSKYSVVDVDYLKVPHHGSSTSSSELFLKKINPQEVFIIVHRLNKFDHPNEGVITRYLDREIKVYRTDILGTIEVEYYFGSERKKYNKP